MAFAACSVQESGTKSVITGSGVLVIVGAGVWVGSAEGELVGSGLVVGFVVGCGVEGGATVAAAILFGSGTTAVSTVWGLLFLEQAQTRTIKTAK